MSSTGSGLFETRGSRVFFLGAGASNTGAGEVYGFGCSFTGSGSFFTCVIGGAGFSSTGLCSIFGGSGSLCEVVSPFMKLSNKCINTGNEGST